MPALLSEDGVLHSQLTGTDVHEPKDVEIADLGDVYVADGSGSGSWQPQVELALPPKFISGFAWENSAGDATNDITILAGSCRDSGDTEDIKLTSSLTKRLDAAWTAGNNNGGRDTGSVANTTYHIFAIKDSITGAVDILFSTSPSAPTMPTGYDKRRRIGSFRRISGAIQTMSVNEIEGGGVEVLLTPVVETLSGSTTGSATRDTVTLANVPTGVKMYAELNVVGDDVFLITSLDQAGGTAGNFLLSSFTGKIRTNTSAQYGINSSASVTYSANLLGWVDTRR